MGLTSVMNNYFKAMKTIYNFLVQKIFIMEFFA